MKNSKFKVGQRVLVHQWNMFFGGADSPITIMHDCSLPDAHWESRVVRWDPGHACPRIATPCRHERGNPNNGDWPYWEDSLEILEGEDWADKSEYEIGQTVKYRMEESAPGSSNPDDVWKIGDVVEATIVSPHIEPNDWYIGFLVPDGSGTFYRCVHESTFVKE